jgi:hypothetical protein
MKTIYTFLFFGFAFMLKANDTLKMDKVYQKIILDNTPLSESEKLTDFNRQRIKSFTNHAFKIEDLEKNKWIFYRIEILDIENSLMPRLMYALINDPEALRFTGYGNTFALEVTDNFDVAWLEKSMKNINLNYTVTDKSEFINNYNK